MADLIRQWIDLFESDPEPDNPFAMIVIVVATMSLIWGFALVTPN